ncbi:hypothetical protein C9374_012658 [Naegleria lovaniensis]|uniref:Methyltransferase domain-containing protein n=1 Tax=Naegleria lovaniensis TaxID=51637 RepID=A0AA88KQE7_NAELO|nr:uncharacterized protein C9374_012658 [Naegleria lovaniensis]KAG2392406.1 hypothetical protein C9374_012658 [Naegleria lovaniensis]
MSSAHPSNTHQFALFETAHHTNLYSKFRPTYPASLYDEKIMPKISSIPSEKLVILDLACGSGQATYDLCQRNCKLIIGIDPSLNQIANALNHPRKSSVPSDCKVFFEVAAAEDLDQIVEKYKTELLDGNQQDTNDGVFDLITVAQGVHWFHFEKVFELVKKYLKRGGVFCAWGYVSNVFENEQAQQIFEEFYNGEELREFWSERRRYLDEAYKTIPHIPFPENIVYETHWDKSKISLSNYIGYLNTWSAVNAYGEKYGMIEREQLLNDHKLKMMRVLGLKDDEDLIDFNLPYVMVSTKKP